MMNKQTVRRRLSPFRIWAGSMAIALAVGAFAGGARAEGDAVLLSLKQGGGPAAPQAGLISGPGGKLYFTTIGYSNGSVQYPGAAVAATLNKGATAATVATIHVFAGGRGEGAYPSALTYWKGSLYGTTFQGGDLNCPLQNGCGTVFKLTPSAKCKPTGWCEKVLYQFLGKTDGMEPAGGVIADSDGNLYGTTETGGEGCNDGCGTIFKLSVSKVSPTGYKESILYRFPPRAGTFVGKFGSSPQGPLYRAANGALYGTAQGGGTQGFGTVFEFTPERKLIVMHYFGGPDGAAPQGGLVLHDGAFYGTSAGDDSDNYGTVYKLAPEAGGKWRFTRLDYVGSAEFAAPTGNVTFDAATGALYFTLSGVSGAGQFGGGIGKLANGAKEAVLLHEFTAADDAQAPYGTLILLGNELYGTAWTGGRNAAGALFKLKP
jgi:uncharacterized repeat protein (TIGR03803 family)